MKDDVSIVLSKDEALVLFEFFARFGDTDEFTLKNNAEYLAFQKISAQLENSLVEIVKPNYLELMNAAREKISSGYEGLAPGVIK